MPPIVPLADALAHLGITPGANPAVDDKVSDLLDAISAELRRLTRRGFEGGPTVYDEVLRVAGAATVILPHAPVSEVLAVRETYFDGSEEAVLDPRVVSGGVTTTLAAAAASGATNLKVAAIGATVVGTRLQVSGSGVATEVVRVTAVGTAGAGGTGLTTQPALRWPHASGAAVTEVAGSVLWLLDLPRRGRVRLARRMEYGRFTYLVDGAVPADVTSAALEWLDEGWAAMQDPDTNPATRALSSQSHDSWSESYEPSTSEEQAGTVTAAIIARRPPPRVTSVVLGYWHPSGAVEPVT